MNLLNFIIGNRIILIPALVIIGLFVKNINVIPDKFIPIILMTIGIGLSVWIEGMFTPQAIVQGVMVSGAAVMGHQIPKQLKKDE